VITNEIRIGDVSFSAMRVIFFFVGGNIQRGVESRCMAIAGAVRCFDMVRIRLFLVSKM
jgi:hypothetical protein